MLQAGAGTIAAPANGEISGRFGETHVRTGRGGGLVHPVATEPATHYHAARLPDIGDVVLAITRTFDPRTSAARRIELRAFTAAAPDRGRLAAVSVEELLASDGALAAVELDLARAGDVADERRPAELARCAFAAAAGDRATGAGLAEWMRRAWETELAFGSWPAIRGRLEHVVIAERPHGRGGSVTTRPAAWAADWLEATDHLVEGVGFLKVLGPSWLEDVQGMDVDAGTAHSDSRDR